MTAKIGGKVTVNNMDAEIRKCTVDSLVKSLHQEYMNHNRENGVLRVDLGCLPIYWNRNKEYFSDGLIGKIQNSGVGTYYYIADQLLDTTHTEVYICDFYADKGQIAFYILHELIGVSVDWGGAPLNDSFVAGCIMQSGNMGIGGYRTELRDSVVSYLNKNCTR